MTTILTGIFFILHGLVHLLYAGQGRRIFELRPGLTWPDGSWLFSKFLRDETTRRAAVASLAIAALGFAAGGAGLLFRQEWWRPLAMGAAIFSSLIFILFWDGRFQALDAKGGVGISINLAILAIVLNWRP